MKNLKDSINKLLINSYRPIYIFDNSLLDDIKACEGNKELLLSNDNYKHADDLKKNIMMSVLYGYVIGITPNLLYKNIKDEKFKDIEIEKGFFKRLFSFLSDKPKCFKEIEAMKSRFVSIVKNNFNLYQTKHKNLLNDYQDSIDIINKEKPYLKEYLIKRISHVL